MHSDCGLLIGTRHSRGATPCQDYALAGARPLRASTTDSFLSAIEGEAPAQPAPSASWGVIADGCSGGKLTDLGARALSIAMRSVLVELGAAAYSDAKVLQAELLRRSLPTLDVLDPSDGLATVGAVYAESDRALAMLAGDGLLICKRLDGSFDVIEQRFTENAPLYLNYFRHSAWLEAFKAGAPGQLLEVIRSRFDAEGVEIMSQTNIERIDLTCAVRTYEWSIDRDDLAMMFVTTDGSTSLPGISTGGAVAQIVAIKSLTGEFLRRRMGALGAKWSKAGTYPDDDLAVAGINLRAPQIQGV